MTRTFDGDDGTFTLLFSVISVGSLAGALLDGAAHDRSPCASRSWLGRSASAWPCCCWRPRPTLAASPSRSAMLIGFASITFMTASTAIVQLRADPAMRGRVLALQAMVFLGSTPIGGPILGAVCDAFGARMGLVVGGVAASARRLGRRHAGRRVSLTEAEPCPTTASTRPRSSSDAGDRQLRGSGPRRRLGPDSVAGADRR